MGRPPFCSAAAVAWKPEYRSPLRFVHGEVIVVMLVPGHYPASDAAVAIVNTAAVHIVILFVHHPQAHPFVHQPNTHQSIPFVRQYFCNTRSL